MKNPSSPVGVAQSHFFHLFPVAVRLPDDPVLVVVVGAAAAAAEVDGREQQQQQRQRQPLVQGGDGVMKRHDEIAGTKKKVLFLYTV